MTDRLLRTASLLVVLVLGVAAPAAGQTEVTLQPVKDNTLFESLSGSLSNGAGAHLFAGRTSNGELRRGLLAFDVAGAVPAGAQISSVTLSLSMSMTAVGPQPVALHRVTQDWGEGTSNASGNEGGGGGATEGDATWLHTFFDASTWQAEGGDFAATPSASAQVGGDGRYLWGSTDAMVSDVQQWLDQPATNFGWILIGNEAGGRTAKRFDSRENPSAAARPALRITYATATDAEAGSPLPPFRLEGAHPNPARAATTVTYTLDAPQAVTLTVYDVLGRAVHTLGRAPQAVGTHRVALTLEALPAGLYLYCLTGDGARACRRLAVLR